MVSLINKQLLLTAYAYLFIMGQQGSEALQLRVEQTQMQKNKAKLEPGTIAVAAAVLKAFASSSTSKPLGGAFGEIRGEYGDELAVPIIVDELLEAVKSADEEDPKKVTDAFTEAANFARRLRWDLADGKADCGKILGPCKRLENGIAADAARAKRVQALMKIKEEFEALQAEWEALDDGKPVNKNGKPVYNPRDTLPERWEALKSAMAAKKSKANSPQ